MAVSESQTAGASPRSDEGDRPFVTPRWVRMAVGATVASVAVVWFLSLLKLLGYLLGLGPEARTWANLGLWLVLAVWLARVAARNVRACRFLSVLLLALTPVPDCVGPHTARSRSGSRASPSCCSSARRGRPSPW